MADDAFYHNKKKKTLQEIKMYWMQNPHYNKMLFGCDCMFGTKNMCFMHAKAVYNQILCTHQNLKMAKHNNAVKTAIS